MLLQLSGQLKIIDMGKYAEPREPCRSFLSGLQHHFGQYCALMVQDTSHVLSKRPGNYLGQIC